MNCQFQAHSALNAGPRLSLSFVFDGNWLRVRCQEDHDLGYEMLKHFTELVAARLDATRLQLLDLYSVDEHTASREDIIPFCQVLSRIAEHPINRIEELLPWNLSQGSTEDSSRAA